VTWRARRFRGGAAHLCSHSWNFLILRVSINQSKDAPLDRWWIPETPAGHRWLVTDSPSNLPAICLESQLTDSLRSNRSSLAILGESSVLANAQVATLSLFFLLPRLIPAPQALIRIARPERLSPSATKVVGSKSGAYRDNVNHVAHLLHDGNSLPAYSVRCHRVTKAGGNLGVKARALSPLTFLSILGCAMSTSLLVLSIIEEDGMTLLATILLSFLATLIGIGNHWKLVFMKRTATRVVPVSDVVIEYPQGAFLIVKCDEDIARELYWHPERCHYHVGVTTYRIISLVATLMLMFGVVFLGNATLTLQTCFAAAYLILNAVYWVVAALPQQWNWDLSCFRVETIHYNTDEKSKTFTLALWKAIAITQSIDWVKIARSAPVSTAWQQWLEVAGDQANQGDPTRTDTEGKIILPEWDAEDALTEFLNPSQAMKSV
jgi:hypothetical protein